MRFFRIQKNGVGPYHNGDVPMDNDDYDRHPTPLDDGLGYLPQSWVCGFESLEQLTTWFDIEMMQAIIENGKRPFSRNPGEPYYVSMYEIPDDHVNVGICQAIGPKNMLTLVSQVSMEEFISHRITTGV